MIAILPDDMVMIKKSVYAELLDDQLMLEALRQSGVDNWDWYGDACDQYREWKQQTPES